MFDGQMRWYGMVYEGYLIPTYIISQQGVFYHCSHFLLSGFVELM
jgi:hypothetical protein